MVSYVGLYYPFIHFRNEGWLKLTALYWDSLRRIVPSGAGVHDTDEVKRLVDDGFIQNKKPYDAALQISYPFRDLIAVHGDTLHAQFAVAKRDSWPDDPHTRLYAPGRDPKLAYVFDQKMDRQLLSDLFGAGLIASRSDDPRWIGMHPRLVKVYMMSLAEAMASKLGAHPLTDESFDHVAVTGLTMDRLAAALFDLPELSIPATVDDGLDREVEAVMVSLAFRNVVPIDAAHIPAQKIIDFRKTHAEERGLFQAEIAKLTEGLAYLQDVDDPREVEQYVRNEYDKTLAPRLERLRNDLKGANIDTAESAMAVSVGLPAALVAIFHAVGFTPTPSVGAAASLTLAAWAIWHRRNKAVDNLLRPSPEAYLYRAEKLSTPKVMANEIYTSSRKFLPNVR